MWLRSKNKKKEQNAEGKKYIELLRAGANQHKDGKDYIKKWRTTKKKPCNCRLVFFQRRH